MDVQFQLSSDQATISRLRRLLNISVELNSVAELNTQLQIMMDAATELTESEAASVMLLDPRTRELYIAATSRSSHPGLNGMTVPLDSIAGTILVSEKPLIVPDVHQDPRFHEAVSESVDFPVRSILGVPMLAEGRKVGVLEALNKIEGEFTQDDVQTLATLASLAAVAIRKAGLIIQLQNANEQLNDLDQLKSDFIAIASHELRTPLLIILGYAHLLRERVGGEEMDRVLEAAERLRNLTQTMFNLQYIDTGEAKLNRTIFCLNQLASEIIDEQDSLFTAKEQNIDVKLEKVKCRVVADRESVRLILNNLISNAIRFTQVGGRIALSVIRRPDEAWVAVRDNGIGIPKAEQNRIFDRFYQVEPHLTRQHGGLGLGLAVAKDLVDLQSGRIWVKSKKGKGSTFTFALPLARTAKSR